MATLAIRLPDDKHERLKAFAQSKGISVNKLMEERSTVALTEFDAFTRFKAMAAVANPSNRPRTISTCHQFSQITAAAQ